MEFLLDPTVWIGLATLVILEIVLGIDNLVFIAILADKLPPEERDRARLTGLMLALFMRLGMLSVMSWLVTLTDPLFSLGAFTFSGRDLILLGGGLFLVFKATTELHERLEGQVLHNSGKRKTASFWLVVAQIIVLDAVFSLDSVVTAVGMVDKLWVMMTAVVLAMMVMVLASKPLTRFVNAHPTVVILCLSFLLMIGFSLTAEGFSFHIPKGYLYAAIGFSILIEVLNQVAQRNFARHEARRPRRERTAEAILRLMGSRKDAEDGDNNESSGEDGGQTAFQAEERYMMSGVLSLADRSVRSLMTPRQDISWVDVEAGPDDIRAQLLATPHSLFPVCRDTLDQVLGVARVKDLLTVLDHGENLSDYALKHPPIIVPEQMDVLRSLSILRQAKGSLVLVMDEFGAVQGLLTPLDILEAIAGEFPDADETPDVVREKDSDPPVWRVRGSADLHQLEQLLGVSLTSPTEEYTSLAGLLLALHKEIPKVGTVFHIADYRFDVLAITNRRIELVRISPQPADDNRAHEEA